MDRAMVRARRNLARVSVLFSSNSARRVERSARVAWTDALGSVGGSLGLFTGFSLLSLCELVYFAAKAACAVMRVGGGKKGGNKVDA